MIAPYFLIIATLGLSIMLTGAIGYELGKISRFKFLRENTKFAVIYIIGFIILIMVLLSAGLTAWKQQPVKHKDLLPHRSFYLVYSLYLPSIFEKESNELALYS